ADKATSQRCHITTPSHHRPTPLYPRSPYVLAVPGSSLLSLFQVDRLAFPDTGSKLQVPASRTSLIACQTRRPCHPLSIHHRLLPISPTHYSLNTHHEDAPDDELGFGP
ncbi:hypothetical protein EDB85DRAFT_2289108, partial [Lactarius pseudohatsudake]